jgi:ribosome biogenesis protein ERB1
VHGDKVGKSVSGDRIDQALANADGANKFVVHDMLNDRQVELTARQIELIRRVQAGAFAHPEHEAYPDYIDYFSGVDKEISGINSNLYEPKRRFQPSQWEKYHVDKLLRKLRKGQINMDYLTGKLKDMNELRQPKVTDKPFMLWKGDEEEVFNNKGPQHIAAPKLPPPGHAESYIPPDEYLPTEEELKEWKQLDPRERPHGLLIPKKHANLRSVGAYDHAVQETFERCLDLYLCPRILKRRLNIDPESLVPKIHKASDLKPFPTTPCLEYKTPFDGDTPPIIRCVSPSPDGQFLVSGASDGYVRLWEVQTGRLLQSWDLSSLVKSTDVETVIADESDDASQPPKPVVSLIWNPNRSHHVVLAAVGRCVVVLATGTAKGEDALVTAALLSAAMQGSAQLNAKAQKVVKWIKVPTASDKKKNKQESEDSMIGPVCLIQTTYQVSQVNWHAKGDYCVSVAPKAGAAAVLIHQLSKANSQQPFGKSKTEAQLACFHPNKPFLFVASHQHVRVYHLVKQAMVKRLSSGCRWISSIDVHPSGDHLIVGSLDRRMVWFDLDLGGTPYKTLKYHEGALRTCGYHKRYPLMASAADDGAVHVFHCMVYNDLMRNPLIVPVKILRGHGVKQGYGVLTVAFHPSQPWIFTGGADGKIILYQDI